MPERIQLKRTKGWRMPPNTVKVDRTTRWGNPYRLGDSLSFLHGSSERESPLDSMEKVMLVFRLYALARMDNEPGWLEPLRGKNLACWCKPGAPCHADVLLELANASLDAADGDR